MPNRVFNRVVSGNMLPGVANMWQFSISNNNREFKLKSLTFDMVLRFNAALSGNIPLSRVREIFYYLQFGNAASPIGNAFDRTAVPPGGVVIDNMLLFFEPRKVNFDSFFISNILACVFDIENYDVLNTVFYSASIIAEIEDLE